MPILWIHLSWYCKQTQVILIRYRVRMYFINYQLLLPVVTCNLYISNYNLVSSLLVVSGSTPPSTVYESLHAYVEDGSTHSSIRDPHGILWYIPLGPHHDRLATYHLSRREMVTRDTRFIFLLER